MGEYEVHRARFYDHEPKSIQSISYDDIDKKIAISRSDNTIEIWCGKSECFESRIVPTSDRQVEVVLWCRSQLLSAGLDGFIVLYDLSRLTAKKLVPSIGGAIWCMTRNKSETKIAVGTEDGYVVLYEIQIDGVIFEKSFHKQDSRILSIAWHRDEEMIATGGIDNIRVWNTNTGQVVQRISVGRVEKNKETLVWCLAFTSNLNVISGDSRGKVSVWNSELGTLEKAFQTHSVDVLCLCVDESETSVFCSGIDPSIVQLKYIKVNETDTSKSWIKTQVFYQHTHDVRSLLIANKKDLVSGGVDTKVIFRSLAEKTKSSIIRRYNTFPQRDVVEVCNDYVLMQYSNYVELWRMGESSENIANSEDGKNMSINSLPKKYLQLKSKNDLHIVCSSFGIEQETSQVQTIWLAYSDINVIHIYKVHITAKKTSDPVINIAKINSLPLACGNRPAVSMKFYTQASDDNNNKKMRLCYLTNKSCLQSLELTKDRTGFMLESTIQCVSNQEDLTDNRVYIMECRDDYIATADTDFNVNVWSLKSNQIIATIPHYDSIVTGISFHAEKNIVLITYANRKIIEFDFEANEFTDWSRKNSNHFPKEWFKPHNKLLNCFYDLNNDNNIIAYDENYLIFLDKTIDLSLTNKFEKLFQNKENVHPSGEEDKADSIEPFKISNRYKFILHASQPKSGKLFVVEITPLSLSERLPASLKQKKFGT